MQCAAYDPVSHRHAVEGEFKRQLRRLLYDVHVRPCDCAVCRMVVGCVDVRLTCRTIPDRSMLDDRYFLPGLRRRHSPAGPSGGSYVR